MADNYSKYRVVLNGANLSAISPRPEEIFEGDNAYADALEFLAGYGNEGELTVLESDSMGNFWAPVQLPIDPKFNLPSKDARAEQLFQAARAAQSAYFAAIRKLEQEIGFDFDDGRDLEETTLEALRAEALTAIGGK